MVIAGGRIERVLPRLCWRRVGTLFLPRSTSLVQKRLVGLFYLPAGRILIDEGAANALQNKGSSLLPIGIVGRRAVEKESGFGDCTIRCGSG